MLACLHRFDGAFGVGVVPCTNADSLKFGQCQHFVYVGIKLCNAVFLTHQLETGGINVAEGVNFRAWIVHVSVQMRTGNVAYSDDTYFYSFHLTPPR